MYFFGKRYVYSIARMPLLNFYLSLVYLYQNQKHYGEYQWFFFFFFSKIISVVGSKLLIIVGEY